MVTRVEWNRPVAENERLAWCEWLRQHSIDPDTVAVVPPGFIEVDSDARLIRYLAFDVNENGNRYVAPCGRCASTSVRVVQLESPPSDFPVVS